MSCCCHFNWGIAVSSTWTDRKPERTCDSIALLRPQPEMPVGQPAEYTIELLFEIESRGKWTLHQDCVALAVVAMLFSVAVIIAKGLVGRRKPLRACSAERSAISCLMIGRVGRMPLFVPEAVRTALYVLNSSTYFPTNILDIQRACIGIIYICILCTGSGQACCLQKSRRSGSDQKLRE
jgi:hypothetical protein